MEKIKSVFLTIVFFFVISLTSCRPVDYADKYYNVKWSSDDPKVEFVVLSIEEEMEDNGFNFGYINTGVSIIEIACVWTLTNELDVYYKDKVKMKGEDDALSDDEIAFRGKYTIKGNKITVKIAYDTIFDYKYETITFVKTNL